MLGVQVPAYIFWGDSVQLSCDYDMQMDSLYSVIWYKDNEEFYRFVPSSKHLKHSFKMDGITVDVSRLFLKMYFEFELPRTVVVYGWSWEEHATPGSTSSCRFVGNTAIFILPYSKSSFTTCTL